MNKLASTLVIAYFFIVILLPPAGLFLGISSSFESQERRTLAKPPIFTWLNYSFWPKMLDNYYDDNFGFRHLLLTIYDKVQINFIKNQFLFRNIYSNGWLFESEVSGDQTIRFYQGLKYTDLELSRIKQALEEDQNLLAKEEVPYFVVIVPTKSEIYSDLLPFNSSQALSYKLDQLVKYLKDNSTVTVIDLRDALIKAKGEYPLYFRTEHHWTNYGAFIAYQEILKEYAKYYPKSQILQSKDFLITTEDYHLWRGDSSTRFPGSPILLDQGVKMDLKVDPANLNGVGNVVVFGDSFTHFKRGVPRSGVEEILPSLSEQFDLFFKEAPYKNTPEDIILPKMNIEKLIPVIRAHVSDPNIQNHLISYLLNTGVKSDDLEGFNQFLMYNFDKVVTEDPLKVLTKEDIERLKPNLVIRESYQKTLETLYLRNTEKHFEATLQLKVSDQ